MHSSRMTTVRCSGHLGRGGVWPEGRGDVCRGWGGGGGVCPGGIYLEGCLAGGVYQGWCLPGGAGYLHVCPGGVCLEWCLPGVVAGWGGLHVQGAGGVVSAQ